MTSELDITFFSELKIALSISTCTRDKPRIFSSIMVAIVLLLVGLVKCIVDDAVVIVVGVGFLVVLPIVLDFLFLHAG